MTDSFRPGSSIETSPIGQDPDLGVETRGAAELARDDANELKEHVTDAGSDVVETGTDELSNLVGEATTQARDLANEARDELRNQADAQQQRAAATLRAISDELTIMAESSESDGFATSLVHQAALRTDKAASWLSERNAGSLLAEVKSFAAKRPGAFITGAVVAGVLVGRLTRSVVSNAQEDTPSAPSGGSRQRDGEGRSQDGAGGFAPNHNMQTSAASALPPTFIDETSTPVYSSIAEQRGDGAGAESPIAGFTAATANEPRTEDAHNG